MTRRLLRRMPLLAALSLVGLSACGDPEVNLAPPDSSAAAPSADGRRPPTPIEYTTGGAGGPVPMVAGAETATADGRVADTMIAPSYVADFVVAAGLPALPTNDTGYVYDAAPATTAEQAAEIAAVFGVSGEVVRVDEWQPGGWQIGPTDGSGPSVYLSDDAQHTWSFSPALPERSVSSGCDVAAAPPGGVASSDASAVGDVPVCDTAAPPTGVPTAEEAEAMAGELLAALGVDPAGMQVEPYADEWSASVSVGELVDGLPTGRSWNFGFGTEGALQWANGSLGVPQPVGPYPLVDLDTALARLDHDQLGGAIAVDLARADATEVAVAPVPAGPPTTTVPGDVQILPVPIDTFPAPEPVTVTLVDVQPDLWWASDADGSVWLVPGYRFVGDDGGWYTVPAVTDEYLIEVPAPVQSDPAPVPGTDVPAASPPATAPRPTEAIPPATAPTVPIVDQIQSLGYYPACGNEILDLDGATWYPVPDGYFHDEFRELYAEITSVAREEPVAPRGFARTLPPGPGDDVGTLVVWSDGVARFTSDSGDLVRWLTAEPQTYGWVC